MEEDAGMELTERFERPETQESTIGDAELETKERYDQQESDAAVNGGNEDKTPFYLSKRNPFGRETWRWVELGLLVGLIVVVWGLLLLPFIFYYLPGEKVNCMQPFSLPRI